MQDRWKYLLRYLRPERPPDDMKLYVRPPRSSADDICDAFEADPTSFQKFLLVGARGGGKSTELRAVEQRLEHKATLATIDLDASGVSASTIAAFDLLYVSGLALLRLTPEEQKNPLYDKLIKVYAGDQSGTLGDLQDALGGLASFADAASKLAKAMDLATAVPAISGGIAVVQTGLRLLTRRDGFVAEASPQGRALQAVCTEIARAARQNPDNQGRPICVLIDGLEKMNGEANSRFEHIFCQTRLVADTEWSAAIAAPPSTLTKTHGAHSVGYETQTVYGFDSSNPDDVKKLVELLARRFEVANLDPRKCVADKQLERIAQASGGLPRHAIRITAAAVRRALGENASRIDAAHVEYGIQKEAETLGLGLTEGDIGVMKSVHRSHHLPAEERAAKLFADGRILAHPPGKGSSLPRFVVHPLLRRDIEEPTDPADDSHT